MARTPKERMVASPPPFKCFKPAGIPSEKLLHVSMELDAYEAIRLADFLGYEHEAASEAMQISRSTFTRLLERARHTLSRLLVEGVRLEIEGGAIHFKENLFACTACHHFFRYAMDEVVPKACPLCHHGELQNLAHTFGHGSCCIKENL